MIDVSWRRAHTNVNTKIYMVRVLSIDKGIEKGLTRLSRQLSMQSVRRLPVVHVELWAMGSDVHRNSC